ncbi:MAG TPA: VOC family protein [Thermoplasmata archaeon]|nr:VOC family protein [Thermoplasmata archaeon]
MPIVQDIGHLVFEVGDMDTALRFYRDTLGFKVAGKVDPVWTVLATTGGTLTLFRTKDPIGCSVGKDGSPLNLHVANFGAAADALEGAGCPVHRDGESAGSVRDPWGNVLGLHDHRKG